MKTNTCDARTTSLSDANTRHFPPGSVGEPPTRAESSQYPSVGPPVDQVPTAWLAATDRMRGTRPKVGRFTVVQSPGHR